MRSPLLWEWMVGFGILVCAAGIFWPLTACACSQPTPRKGCISNIKQSGTAIHLYLADHNDVLPNRDRWMDAIEPYLKVKNTLHDPEVKLPGAYGYSFDSRLSDKPYASFSEPDKQSMIFDSSNLGRNASDPFVSLPTPPRHKGNNVGYLDGYVKALKAR